MLKNKILKIFIPIAIIICLCTVVAFATLSDGVEIFGDEVKSEYELGANITLPEKQFVKGEERVVANPTLTYPSGKKSTFSVVKLDELGAYTLNYTAVVGGVENSKSYNFETKLSSASMWGDNHMIIPTQTKVPTYYSATEYEDKDAVLLSAHAKGYTKFQSEIYLGDNTLSDELINLMVVPRNLGVLDFQSLKIVLEDVKDTSNKLYIKISACGYDMANQADFDLSTNRFKAVVQASTDDVNYTRASAPSTYCLSSTGFYGQLGAKSASPALPISIRYSNTESKVKVVCGNQEFELNLFDETFMGVGHSFKGIASNRANLYLGFEKFKTNAEGKVAVYSVDGLDMGAKIAQSQKSPAIAIDYKTFTPDTIKAKVNSKHYFLDAYVIDAVNKNLDCEVTVYYCNNDAMEKLNTGYDYFVPNRVGKYIVEYVSQNNFAGKSGQSSYLLNVVSAQDCAMDFTFGALPSSVDVGQNVIIPECSISGGIGEKKVVYSAKVGGKEVQIKGNAIFAEYAGELILTASVTDDAYDAQNPFTKTTSITVAGSNETFLSVGYVPTRVMAGDSIDLNVDAYKFTENGKTNIDYTVKIDGVLISGDVFTPSAQQKGVREIVIDADGAQRVISIEVVEPYKGASQSVLDYFSIQNATAMLSDEYDNIRLTVTQDAQIEFLRTIDADAFSFGFAVKGNSSKIEKHSAKFDKLKITLIEATDADKQVSFYISKGSENNLNYSTFTYNGKSKAIYGSFYDVFAMVAFNVRYDKDSNSLYDSKDTKLAELNKANDGSQFDGFEEIYLKVEVLGVTDTSIVHIKSIANQSFDVNVKSDKNAGPDVVFNSKEWNAKANEEFVFPSCAVYDTLSEVASFEMKMTDSNSNVLLTSSDLSGLKYTFTANGNYNVTYTAVDIEGNVNVVNKVVSVKDDLQDDVMDVMGVKVFSSEVSAPSLVIRSIPTKSAKVNEAFNVAKIEVDDNGGKNNLKMYLYVIAPDGGRALVLCTPSKTNIDETLEIEEKVAMFTSEEAEYITYTANKAGKYLVYYLILDDSGLSTIAYYAVEVK